MSHIVHRARNSVNRSVSFGRMADAIGSPIRLAIRAPPRGAFKE
jgi:hypothetical protein